MTVNTLGTEPLTGEPREQPSGPVETGECGAYALVPERSLEVESKGEAEGEASKGRMTREKVAVEQADKHDQLMADFMGMTLEDWRAKEAYERQQARPPYVVKDVREEVEAIGLNDTGNGKRFAAHHGSYVLNVAGDWMQNKGGKWFNIGQSDMVRLAKETVDAMLQARAASLHQGTNEGLWAQFGKFAAQSAEMYRLKRMVESAASTTLSAEAKDFDADAHLLNTRNGVVDLRTGILRPHKATDRFTMQTTFPYAAKAEAPEWLAFIEQVTDGDKGLARFLQMAAGYSITGETSEQCLMFLLGYAGRNGKSTMLEVIRAVIGNYAATVPSSFFLDSHGVNRRAEQARLGFVRMVTSAELEERWNYEEAFLKELTGEDTQNQRFLFEGSFDRQSVFKCWVHGNSLPQVKTGGHALWRRFHLVPFNRRFEGTARNPQLKRKLAKEGVGILAWLVEGARMWYEQGTLVPSESMLCLKEEVMDDVDPLRQFIRACCNHNPAARLPNAKLLTAFNDWATANNKRPWGTKMLSTRLLQHGGIGKETDSRSNTRVWVGLELKP